MLIEAIIYPEISLRILSISTISSPPFNEIVVGCWLMVVGFETGAATFDLRLSTNFNMSSLVTRPSFPEPFIASNSAIEIPSCLAIFLTNGEKNLSELEKLTGSETVATAFSIISSIATTLSGATSGVETTGALMLVQFQLADR